MDKSKILVLGRGFLGKQFEKNGYTILSRKDAPFYDEWSFIEFSSKYLKDSDYEVIINCIGKADTRWCENRENWKTCFFTNATIPEQLSKYCKYYEENSCRFLPAVCMIKIQDQIVKMTGYLHIVIT